MLNGITQEESFRGAEIPLWPANPRRTLPGAVQPDAPAAVRAVHQLVFDRISVSLEGVLLAAAGVEGAARGQRPCAFFLARLRFGFHKK